MRIPIELDRSSGQPLASQLADRLREAIQRGRIPRGGRLPSSRALADQLEVARNTVVRAYETLVVDGFAESRAASGFYALAPDEALSSRPRFVQAKPARAETEAMPLPARPVAPHRHESDPRRTLYDFVPGRPSVDLFPVKTWRRLLKGALSYGGAAGLSEPIDPTGLRELRGAIAAHLSVARGIVADPAQVLVLAGVQEGLCLAARLFLSPEATAVVENPCYESAPVTFEAEGATVLAVDVDEEGLDVSRLPEETVALLYTTPGHQYPTGHTLSMPRRLALVAWARRNGCYLVEDDYDSEFQYDGSPLQALAGIGPDCTIHLGTFSTTLGAGLRLGYAVVPPALIDAMRAAKALSNSGGPWLDQAVLAEFLRSGSYALHVTRSRTHYKESRDALLAALRRNFGSVDVTGEAAGLHVLWRLPAGVPDAPKLEALARQQRVGVYSLASAGACELRGAVHRRSLLLGFAGLSPKPIELGIARLSDAVDDTLDMHHELVGELLEGAEPPYRGRHAALRGPGGRQGLPRPRPAIRTIAPRRAVTDMPHFNRTREARDCMRMVRGIYRYPIKGLSAQPIPGVEIEEGKPFPFDRVFALVRPGAPIDPDSPRWAKKGLFLMLMLEEALASVETYVDAETLRLTVRRSPANAPEGRGPLLRADLATRDGRQAVETFFHQLLPSLKATPRFVRSADGHFMDKPDNVLSCINLATVRSLEAEWGQPINPLRFRANFYIEGARPWEEFDWIGSDILLGDVLFRVDRRNGRCGATNVNPVTAERDMDIPGSLRKRYGHKDLGVYLVARSSGKVVVGDDVGVPDIQSSAPRPAPFAPPLPGNGRFICRGCYYVYDEMAPRAGADARSERVTPFADLDGTWVCPDCGTHKGNFRPYLGELGAPAICR
jgi:GntR family transcriptional regulator/MocR family aminotransferase